MLVTCLSTRKKVGRFRCTWVLVGIGILRFNLCVPNSAGSPARLTLGIIDVRPSSCSVVTWILVVWPEVQKSNPIIPIGGCERNQRYAVYPSLSSGRNFRGTSLRVPPSKTFRVGQRIKEGEEVGRHYISQQIRQREQPCSGAPVFLPLA